MYILSRNFDRDCIDRDCIDRDCIFSRSPFRVNVKGSSRLCKAGMLHRFRTLINPAGLNDLGNLQTYEDTKNACKQYQNVKRVSTVCFQILI